MAGADYGRYKEGWIDVGNIDTGAGRFYAAINFGDEEIGGDINPADKSITGSHDLIGSAWLYYDVEVCCSADKSTPEFDIKSVKNPEWVKETLSNLIEEERMKKRISGREFMTDDEDFDHSGDFE